MRKKMFAVIQREYITRAKSKGFIIVTLIFPLILVLLFSGYFIFSKIFQPSTKTFTIIDQTGMVFEEFARIQSDKLPGGEPKYSFIKKDVAPGGMEKALADLQAEVNRKELSGYLVIPEDIIEKREAKYSARNVSDFEELESFSRSLSWIVTNVRLEQKGWPAKKIRSEMEKGRVKLVSQQITEKGEIEKSGLSSFMMTYILTYVMFLMIIIYGGILMRSVIEEKTQRITESIVSSISPLGLMFGKMLGICALGLTQLLVFGGFLLGTITFAEPLLKKFGVQSAGLFEIIKQVHFTAPVFGFLILFFLLGFVFYSGLYAALGAMVNTEDEGQQLQMPLVVLFFLSYFIMFSVARNPDTARAFWVSLIPFFTPIVMFARISVSDPILPSGTFLSLVIMALSTILLIWVAAKIYRVGILMYGKKPSFKEALKWIRYK
ncbi:MAG: ABC transporter permease [Candidatus Aminicenantes bacterium]|nr:ABC transporter permease [Candidatus Aminicenantes bacterium]